MKTPYVILIGVALLISACESSEAIYLKHPGTGPFPLPR